jgi:hypothetical protein
MLHLELTASVTKTEPFLDALVGAESLPDALGGTEPLPDILTGTEPLTRLIPETKQLDEGNSRTKGEKKEQES